jgi:polygalacturonase
LPTPENPAAALIPQQLHRRALLRLAATGGLGLASGLGRSAFAFDTFYAKQPLTAVPPAHPVTAASASGWLNVRMHGAVGDGVHDDTPAINTAIAEVSRAGGGTVYLPAGLYRCYSIHLASYVALYLDQGATIMAGETPLHGTTSGGYDAAELQDPAIEAFQDFGHNHWHNSLLWGDGIHDFSILGPGLIWGKGLSRGNSEDGVLPDTNKPGVGNKAIALKNCRNVILRDFSILQGGWFGILATGVDNLTIDNLKIDTNRDGMDIDCCRNVRVSNCTVNSPWDDGICPKSSFALGYARPTENLTITNCFVTGGYELGSVLDGTWKPTPVDFAQFRTGRIKCGTESNGGFLNIAISNCVFERCRGLALETVDGAHLEDITFTGIAMRDIAQAPLFLRLGKRMRGPAGVPIGTLKRIILSDITCSGASMLPSILSGIPGNPIQDVQINNFFLQQVGGGTPELAHRVPPENVDAYPEPTMFGELPATGLFCRHVENLQVSNFEVQTIAPDARPAFWLADVHGADFFRIRAAQSTTNVFSLHDVRDFRVFGSRGIADATIAQTAQKTL